MEIILKGDKSKLKKHLKANSLFMKRHKIEVNELVGSKNDNEEPKLTAKEVAEMIAKIESIEDLKQYGSDERQVVSNAYKKKLKELE